MKYVYILKILKTWGDPKLREFNTIAYPELYIFCKNDIQLLFNVFTLKFEEF